MPQLTRALYENRVVVYVVIAVAVAASVALYPRLPKMYEARASFYVPVVPDVFSLTTETGGGLRAVPAPAVVRDQLRGYFGILNSLRLSTRVADLVPERHWEAIRRGTRFKLTSAGMFMITSVDRDPEISARIANGFADSFNDLFEEISLPRATKTRRFIEDQLDKVRVDLVDAEERLKEFKQRHKTVSVGDETSESIKAMMDLRARRDQATVSLTEVRNRIAVLEKRLADEAQMALSAREVAANPLVQQLEGKLRELEIERAGLRAKFTAAHPDLVRVERQIDEASRRLQDSVRRVVASETHTLNTVHETLRQNLITLYADQRALEAKLTSLAEITRRFDEEMERLPQLQQELTALARAVKHLEETDRALAQKLEDARIQERREIQTFLVVDRAVPPGAPAYPNILLSVPAAGVLGGAVGIAYAILLGYVRAGTAGRALARAAE